MKKEQNQIFVAKMEQKSEADNGRSNLMALITKIMTTITITIIINRETLNFVTLTNMNEERTQTKKMSRLKSYIWH